MAIQDSGSNYQFYDKMIKTFVKRSVFDLSRLHTTTIDFGAIVPVDLIWTLPKDDFDIRIEHLIRALPMVCPPMSRMRVFFHTYWMSFDQMYKHWKVFMSKGRTGKYTATLPYIRLRNTVTAGSLANYLGLPVGLTPQQSQSMQISALPFLMYQAIYKHYYLNANLHTTDTYWFPDDEDDFRLDDGMHTYVYDTGSKIPLDELRYRDFSNDYFTASLPFPMRGDTPSIGLGGRADIKYQNLFDTSYNDKPVNFDYVEVGGRNLTQLVSGNSNVLRSVDGTKSGMYADVTSITAVTLDQFRELVVAQKLMEKMARTDGSYGQFIKTFFDENPQSAYDFRPRYVGGNYAPIVTTEVLQSSESGTTPQGHMSGHGISSADGYIGHLHSDDYGLCMTVASIMPDSMYCQGVDRDWTRKTQEEFYLPERAGLGPQAITVKEIYYSAQDPDKLLSYQDRFDEYRYRQNIVSGKVSDPNNLTFFPYTQARYFGSEPTLSQSFVTTQGNVRHDSFYAGTNEVPFVMQVASKVRAVRPLPYKSIPAGLD